MNDEVKGLQEEIFAPHFSKFIGESIVFTLQTRIYCPVSSTVKVLFLADIHFLATVLSLATMRENFAELVPRALNVFSYFLINSPEMFSAVKNYGPLLKKSEYCISGARSPSSSLALSIFFLWDATLAAILAPLKSLLVSGLLYENDAPILQNIGIWASYLSASSCPSERLFSA